MLNSIKAGTIIIEEGLLLPEGIRVESERYSDDWRVVTAPDRFGLDRELRAVGWNFFFMAGQTKAIVFGSGGEKTIDKAVKRLLAKVKSENFNSLEITEMVTRRFLGVPYVTLFANSRHIQKGPFLQGIAERKRARRDDAGICHAEFGQNSPATVCRVVTA